MLINKKILVCGSGPSLPGQLKNIDLSDFFVVRINFWEKINGYDNKCDAWAFYPYFQGDFKPYLEKAKHIWMPHYGFHDECKRITGITPSYTITKQETKKFHQLIGHKNPTSGAVVIYMATLLEPDVYIAGFDFSKGDKGYYWSDKKPSADGIEHHKQWFEEKWVNKQIETKQIFKLGTT